VVAPTASKSVFRYAADKPYVAAFIALGLVDFTVYALVDHWLALAVYSLFSIYTKAPICAFNHHHQHVPTFTSPVLNRLLEWWYALQTGVAGNAWVLHHSVGHHLNYLDQKLDESRWQRDDGSVMSEFEYSVIVTATAYPRAWKVGAKYPKLRFTFLAMTLISLSTVIGLVAWRPLPGFFVFVVIPLSALFGTAWATYAHHAGRSTASHSVASNNIMQPFYNWLTGNLGYHVAHHTRPGVHWSELPKLHDELKGNIPTDAYKEPGWPWRWFGKTPAP
jgi:fatty acid desaturase